MRINAPWDKTTNRVLTLLGDSGYKITRSFDLKTAREGLQNPEACHCPHHGTERCTCQYQVYLVYGQEAEPLTLVIHGHDDWTHVSIEAGPNGTANHLYEQANLLLAEAHLTE